MNPIVINMDDMSDSTEVYSSRPSPIFAILIWTLAGILVIALVWMGLFRIDLVTHADGMIRSGSATATITNVTDGTILAWDAEDGEYVKAGQTIYSIDPSELKKQEKSCAAELKNTEQRLEILEAYYKELDGESGALDKCKKNSYYEEFKTKLDAVNINRDMVQADAGTQQSQYQNSLNSIDSSISSLTEQQAKLNQMISDMRNRTNSFSSDEVYYHTAVAGYIDQYNYTANQYDIQIEELRRAQESAEQQAVKQQAGNTGGQADAETDDGGGTPAGALDSSSVGTGSNAQSSTDNRNAIAELENQKALALSQLETESIASVEQSLSSVQSNIESLKTNRSEAAGNLSGLDNGSLELSTDQIVTNEKNTVNTEINTYEGQKKEYEETLETVRTRIEECDVKAQTDGYLNLSAEKTSGDHVSAGEQIGNIVPDGNGIFRTVIYVENQDIGSVREGQKIKYEVASYPQTEDYGIFEGEVTSVSKDIKVNSETGMSYYEVEATITARGGADGKETPEFIQGMAVQAKLVTGKESVLRYLLEKIDLVDE